MSKYYKADDVIRAIEEMQAIDIEVSEYADEDEAFMKGYAKGSVDGYVSGRASVEVSEDAISKHDLWRIVEDNAYWVTYNETSKEKGMTLTGINQALNECPPVAPKSKEVIYGNEHNCIMTLFGECSYDETGCGDCAVAEKIRKALSVEASEDAISKAYLEQEIENQTMTVEKDKEYWRGWNNALDKVVELIEDAH